MLKIKVNNYFFKSIILFFLSFNLLSEATGQPGELYAVKVDLDNSGEIIGLIKINNSFYKLVPLAFSKQGKYVEFNNSRTIKTGA